MSTIVGRIEFDQRPIERSAFNAALAQIASDNENVTLSDNAGFGVDTLAIGNNRPPPNGIVEKDGLTIVADAVLDNRNGIAAALGVSPRKLSDLCDTTLILHAYLRWGPDCLAQLEGEFAFAVWHPTKQHLFLARDHIGARPLYWRRSRSSFVFGSDIRALHAFADLDWQIDENIVARYLIRSDIPLPKPFYRDLYGVPAGGTVSADPQRQSSAVWWDPVSLPDVRYASGKDYVERFRELVERAIHASVATDGPVGTHFSGGIDSTAVSVIAQRELERNGRSLVAGYPWTPGYSELYPDIGTSDERHRIDAIAQANQIRCRYGTGEETSASAYFERVIELDGPADLVDEHPVLDKAEEDGLRVMLSGWGGDEAFSAHGFGYLAWLFRTGQLARAFRVNRRYARGFRKPVRFLETAWRHGMLPLLPDPLYRQVSPYSHNHPRKGFANPAFLARLDPDLSTVPADTRWTADPILFLRRLVSRGHLSARMETWASWSAPRRIQYRYPLLNRSFMEFVLGLPPQILFGDGETRYLANRALKGVLPRLTVKNDPVNEMLRKQQTEKGMLDLAEKVSAGGFDTGCDWIDLPALKETLAKAARSDGACTTEDWVETGAAVNVYAMYLRKNAGV